MGSIVAIVSCLLLFSESGVKGQGEETSDGASYCSFPEFMWRGSTRNRTWIQIVYSKAEIWSKTTEMNAFQSELKVVEMEKVQGVCSYGRCGGHGEASDVITRTRHVICLSEHKGDKLRVKWFDDGLLKFSCMKLQMVGDRMLLLSQAPPSGMNEHRLCYDDFMPEDVNLWFDKQSHGWVDCPDLGGFDIIRLETSHDQAISCSTEVNSSRIEFECSEKEGITLTFADPNCSPFPLAGERNVFEMKCWSQWRRGLFLFVVVGFTSTSSKYTLMLPLALENMQVTQLFKFHLSPGIHAPVNYLARDELKSTTTFVFAAKRSDVSLCYDDSPHCEKHVTSQNCYGDQVAKNYANFCLKTCGLCELSPTSRPECKFLKELTGRWLFFSTSASRRHDDDVTNIPQQQQQQQQKQQQQQHNDDDVDDLNSHFDVIKYYFDSGTMHVTSETGTGSYVCKNKHWLGPFYKVLSVLNNGCRPRYFCLNLVKNDVGNLELKTSEPSLRDTSFSICRFQQELETPKILFATQNIIQRSCGFSSFFSSEVSFSDGSSAHGIVSDFHIHDCSTNSLHFRLNHPPHPYPAQLKCLQLMKISSENSLLITQGNEDTMCWIIRQFRTPSSTANNSLVDTPPVDNKTKPRNFHMVRVQCHSVSPVHEYFDPLQTFISSLLLLESNSADHVLHKCMSNEISLPKKEQPGSKSTWYQTFAPLRTMGNATNLTRPNYSHHQRPRTGRVRVIESSRAGVFHHTDTMRSGASNLLSSCSWSSALLSRCSDIGSIVVLQMFVLM